MSRRSVFASLCGLVLLVNLARVGFAPLVEPLKAAFGASDATVGLVVTMAWIGSAAPRIPVGWLLTRVARRHVIFGVGALLTAAGLAVTAVDTVPKLLVAAFVLGLASGAYFIAANPLISELFPDRVGTALGAHGAFSATGAVLATPVVGLALAGGSWRLVFRWLAVAAAVVTVVLVVMARRTDLPAAGAADRDLLGAIRAQWRVILVGITFVGAIGFVWNGVFNFYVTYLITAKTIAPDTARTLLTLVFGSALVAFPVSGRLADRLPSVPYLFAICGAFVVALLALTVAAGVLALVVASIVLGYGIHSLFPAMDAYVLSALPDRHRASAYAGFSGTMMLVQATGSVTLGTLHETGIAFDTIFRTAAAGITVVLVGLATAHRRGLLPDGRPATDGPGGDADPDPDPDAVVDSAD